MGREEPLVSVDFRPSPPSLPPSLPPSPPRSYAYDFSAILLDISHTRARSIPTVNIILFLNSV